jgi:DNA-directed RNA polymerase subunit RPC12/RpoP
VISELHRTLEQELLALLRGASLECPACGEFVLHAKDALFCPECGFRIEGEARAAPGLRSTQAG